MLRFRVPRMPMVAALALFIAIAVAAVAAAPASAAPAVKTASGWKTDPEVWGVNDREMSWNLSDAALAPRIAAVKKLGARWVRFTVNWARIQAAGPGTYRWTELDAMIRRLAAAGIRWRPVTLDVPQWLKSDPTAAVRQPPASSTRVAEFLEALLQRYGTGGTFWASNRDLVARPVLDVEVHNEPNATYFWGFDTSTWYWRTDVTGVGWAKIYGPALDRVRAKYPTARYWMGGLVTPSPSSGGVPATMFVANAFATYPRLATILAGVGVHNYPWASQPGVVVDPGRLRTDVAAVVKTMRAAGGSKLQIQINEFGASKQRVTFEQNRADILARTAELARSNCPIQGIAPFETLSLGENPANFEDWYDLVKPDGALHTEGAAFASEVSAFNAGKEQGSALAVC